MGKIEIDHVPPQKFSRIGASIVNKSSHESAFNNFHNEKWCRKMWWRCQSFWKFTVIFLLSTSLPLQIHNGRVNRSNFFLNLHFFPFRYPQRKFEFSNQKTHLEREKKPTENPLIFSPRWSKPRDVSPSKLQSDWRHRNFTGGMYNNKLFEMKRIRL